MGNALFKGGFVPIIRKINGKSLSTDISLSASDVGASASGHTHADTEISANNGINSASLRDILNLYTIKKTTRDNLDQLNNPNYPHPYETSVSNVQSPNIGLGGGWWHIKYFKHDDNNGFGAQLAISLDSVNRMFFRTSTGTAWNKWTEIYHSDNVSAVVGRGSIAGSYTGQSKTIYDSDTETYSRTTRFINLGVTPKVVMIFGYNGSTFTYQEGHIYNYGGVAITGKPATYKYYKNNYSNPFYEPYITIENNGFTVVQTSISLGNWLSYINLDLENIEYTYVALV